VEGEGGLGGVVAQVGERAGRGSGDTLDGLGSRGRLLDVGDGGLGGKVLAIGAGAGEASAQAEAGAPFAGVDSRGRRVAGGESGAKRREGGGYVAPLGGGADLAQHGAPNADEPANLAGD
jgi:hypothetical protein